MESHGVKRKRSAEAEGHQEVTETKYSRTISNEPQPRFDTSAMPVHATKTTQDYQRLEKLGEGTFGLWYKARDKATDQIVAMKRLEQYEDEWEEDQLRLANISVALEHKHLRLVFDIVAKHPSEIQPASYRRVFLIAEYCESTLRHLLEDARLNHRILSERRVKSVVHQLLLAVEYLHKNSIMHRDIKPARMYLKDGEIKLDIGNLMREYTSDGALSPEVVTLWYRAPELLLSTKHYDFAIDMWSVGCIMGELLKGGPLFPGTNELDMLSRISDILGPVRAHTWPELADLSPAAATLLQAPEPRASLPQIIPRLSRTAHELLRGLLCYNPRDRLTARQALQHEWFSDLSPQLLQYKVGWYSYVELLEWH